MLQGGLTGSISYFNQKPKREDASDFGEFVAFFATSATLAGVGVIANTRETTSAKAIAFSSGIPIAANVHYISKFIGDVTDSLRLGFSGIASTNSSIDEL